VLVMNEAKEQKPRPIANCQTEEEVATRILPRIPTGTARKIILRDPRFISNQLLNLEKISPTKPTTMKIWPS